MIQLTRDIRKIIYSVILIFIYLFFVTADFCGDLKRNYQLCIDYWKRDTAKLDSGITLTKLFENYFGD